MFTLFQSAQEKPMITCKNKDILCLITDMQGSTVSCTNTVKDVSNCPFEVASFSFNVKFNKPVVSFSQVPGVALISVLLNSVF